MDKKTNIGLILCFGILVFFWWLNKPSEEERARWQRYYDSLARVEELRQDSVAMSRSMQNLQADTVNLSDSARIALRSQRFGLVADAVEGDKQVAVLENELIKVYISNQGAKITNVEMAKFLSVHKVTVARILRALKEEQMIMRTADGLLLLEPEKLRQYAENQIELKYK